MNTIKIPRIATKSVWIEVQRQGMIETRKAVRVKCKKQIIEGIEIPSGFELWVPGSIEDIRNGFSTICKISVDDWQINPILKKLYLDKLRAK